MASKLDKLKDINRIKQAIIDQYNIAKGSFNEEIKSLKEQEKAAKLAYVNAQATGNPEVIQQALSQYQYAQNNVKNAEREKKEGLSRINDTFKNPQEYTDGQGNLDTDALKNFGFSDESTSEKGKKPEENKPSSIPLSASFYRGIAASLRNKPQGNLLDAASATSKAQGQNQLNESANRQMEAQASQQIANRNEYAEAGKIASMQNDAQNRQNIANREGLSGSAAALMRTTNAPDVQQQMNRQDSQRNFANQQREKGDIAQQGATESFGLANQFSTRSRDFDEDLDKKETLANGEIAGSDTAQTTGTGTAQTTGTGTAQTPGTGSDTAQTTGTDTGSDTAQTAGTEPSSDLPPTDQPNSGKPEGNVLIADEKGRGKIIPASEEGNQDVPPMKPFQRPENWNLYTPEEKEAEYRKQGYVKEGNSWKWVGPENTKAKETEEAKAKVKDIEDSKGWWQNITPNDPPSDARVKNIRECLSDARMKWIKEDWDNTGKIDPEDWEFLLKRVGKFNHDGRDYDAYNEDDWSDDQDQSVLKAYAEHIRNYLYNYKPEATQVDSRIDPNEEHIGPMAQDIEQVNPACVKETPDGIKTVDTARLAMMNAGAIGDLARQLQELTDKLKALGV